MKCTLVTVLLCVAPCACTDDRAAQSEDGVANTPEQLDAALDAAARSDGSGAAPLDDAAVFPENDAAVPELPDAEVSPYADLRTCSGNPLDTVTWPCASDAATCSEAIRISQMCALPWGCDEYALAVVAAARVCNSGSVISAQACGRTVIELRGVSGSLTRAFYSTGGGLMGIWSATDVASEPQTCSAFVPKDCLDWEGNSLSDIINLCPSRDASTDADAQP